MKNLKEEKGITLVALIITIIVLLILAIVTINSITGDDSLISHAENARDKYALEAEKENSIIQNLLGKIPNDNDAKDIWQIRGMDTTKAIEEKEYEFEGPITFTYENNEYSASNIKIDLKSNGDLYWGRKFNFGAEDNNDYNPIPSALLEGDYKPYFIYDGNKMAFPDAFFGYVTIIFNGDAATLYIPTTLGGTDGTSISSK